MIYDWNRHNLNMDFSHIETGKGRPSDIDMFYIGKGYLILGEIKNFEGTFTENQRRMYEQFVDRSNFKHAIAIYINHDKKVEDRDRNVNVAMCFISEYYMKGSGKWQKPKQPMIVQELFDWVKENWEK